MKLITDKQLKRDIKELPPDYNSGRSLVMAKLKLKRSYYKLSVFCIKRSSRFHYLPGNRSKKMEGFTAKNNLLKTQIAELRHENKINPSR